MISIILIVVGALLAASGFGLRVLHSAFGTTLAVIGGLVLLDGVAGFFIPEMTARTQLWCAGGIMVAFSFCATVWTVVAGLRSSTPKK